MNDTFMKTRPVFPLLLSMALPNVISMLVNSLYNIVDSLFVAQIGEQAMTALSLVFPIQNFVNAVAIGFGIGINAQIALYLGAGDHENANRAATHGMMFSLLHGVLGMVLCIAIMPGFLRRFTTDPALVDMGVTYSTIVFLFSLVNMADLAFEKIFGRAAGVGLFVLVVVSCLGTLNGLMLAATRSLYSVAARGNGPKPEAFLGIDQYTNMPANSAIVGVLMCAVWLTYFYGANLTEGWFGPFCFDSSELPIITLYALYIPMFLNVMRREKELNAFHRYVMPVLSIVCCIFFCVAAVVSHGKAVLYYLIVFAVIMALAIPFYRQGKEKA